MGDYLLDTWASSLPSKAIEVLYTEDHGAAYEVNSQHVLLLEDGRCAVVTECGCSCYDSSQADIEIHSQDYAKQLHREWVRRQTGRNY